MEERASRRGSVVTRRSSARRVAFPEPSAMGGRPLQYLAAWAAHRANLFGRREPRIGIEPFGRLVEQVMCGEPLVSVVVHTPIHASWLDQVEL